MDEELERMMQDALNEAGELDGETTTDENQQEESAGKSDDGREDENSGEDTSEDEDTSDNEDDDVDYEDEDEDSENDSEDDENDSDSEDSDDDENEDNFETFEVELNGQTIELNSAEEVKAFIAKASTMNKPKGKTELEQTFEQGKISAEDLTLLIDAKNGDKKALAKLAKDSNIDIYDIEDSSASEYSPTFKAQIATEVDNVAREILEDTELSQKFQATVKSVPEDFVQAISSDANALRHFGEHVKSGLAQKVIPKAIKAQMLNGGSFMEHYATIGREMANEKTTVTKESKTKRVVSPRAKKLREKAQNKKGSNRGTKTKVTGDDIWNMSDKDFSAKYGG